MSSLTGSACLRRRSQASADEMAVFCSFADPRTIPRAPFLPPRDAGPTGACRSVREVHERKGGACRRRRAALRRCCCFAAGNRRVHARCGVRGLRHLAAPLAAPPPSADVPPSPPSVAAAAAALAAATHLAAAVAATAADAAGARATIAAHCRPRRRPPHRPRHVPPLCQLSVRTAVVATAMMRMQDPAAATLFSHIMLERVSCVKSNERVQEKTYKCVTLIGCRAGNISFVYIDYPVPRLITDVKKETER